ncbi:ABC transporter ATP-binding protein [Marinomonas mediterranea]|uniref:ABC transporter ATP-binding protein n=1 Tax=Marinomonas mediterranea TaxID=119864 RepID=UPI00234AB05A|nr:ABC transporter ATP-binding protein [Marinomonas mediterranea]WCN08883.1 ATP-binding cassette domain-containing protein [Marinomonas mediterranea]WCN12917.1 ATP-binding cassette domain-containing protein [Marinomonas mediterranea]
MPSSRDNKSSHTVRGLNTDSHFSLLWSLIRAEKNYFSLGLLTAVAACVAEVSVYVIMMLAANAVAEHAPHTLFILTGLMALLLITRLGLLSSAYWLCHLAAYRVVQNIREVTLCHITTLPLDKLSQWHRSDIEKSVLRDTNKLTLLLAHYGVETFCLVIQPLLFIGLIAWIDWKFALIALTPLPIALLLQRRIMRDFPKRQAQYNKSVSRIDQAVFDFVQGAAVLKQFLKDQTSLLQLDHAMKEHHDLMMSYTRQLIRGWSLFTTLSRSSVYVTVPSAIWFWHQQNINTIELVLVSVLSLALMKPWLLATQMQGKTLDAFDALNKLLPLLQATAKHTIRLPTPTHWKLSAEHIQLNIGERVLISDLNFHLKKGQRLAITGKSGCGKSSLAKSLMGALSLQQGYWSLDGNRLDQCSEAQRAQWIAIAEQHTFLFRGSLRDNLLLERVKHTSDQFLYQVLDICVLRKVIEQLPNGLDTDIGEASRLLSGGETQRIGLARALLRNTPILIMDEVTSHLDSITERHLLETLSDIFPDQTQILISHRSTTQHYCDFTLSLPDTTLTKPFSNVEETTL